MTEYVTGAITRTTMGIAGWNVTVARTAGAGETRTLAVATGTPGAHNLSEGHTRRAQPERGVHGPGAGLLPAPGRPRHGPHGHARVPGSANHGGRPG
jgi:hypothetical protein